MSRSNWNLFENFLTEQYKALFSYDEDYEYAASTTTPEALALKMTKSLSERKANKDSIAIKAACKHFGIKHTYSSIADFINYILQEEREDST